MVILSSMKRLITLFAVCSLVLHCRSAEELSLLREDNSQSAINMDGYFYTKYEYGYIALFFYENGVVYTTNTIEGISDLEYLDDHIRRKHSEAKAIQLRWFWGIYRTEGDIIKLNYWLSGTGSVYPAEISEGKIVNPSTIRIPWINDQLNEFKFRQFSPKPDSTNAFIK
ncbi:MAG: hypothetical protein WBA17_18460 [Saprospiraceae bacterium]